MLREGRRGLRQGPEALTMGMRGMVQNSLILDRLGELSVLDLPILAGPSRKSFLTHPTTAETNYATAAAVAACVLRGAHLVRVHDVKAMKAVVDVADEIVHAGEEI